MTDWRERCSELAEALCGYTLSQDDCLLVARTRAELALPEPEGGGSIHGLGGEIVATIRAYASVEPQVGASRMLHESNFGVVARAVLARWGRPAIEPVPVAERPWERGGWCDEYGMCWKFYPCDRGWWSYGPILPSDGDPAPFTHCLPHWALPVPTSQEATDA